MKLVAIIGVTGMVGSMVYGELKRDHALVLIYRNDTKLKRLEKQYGGVTVHQSIKFDFSSSLLDYTRGFSNTHSHIKMTQLVHSIGEVDAVINCLGIIRPPRSSYQSLTFFINAAVPHLLASIYKSKLIHVTTDCVFNGKQG